jgi:inner membrane protein
MVFIAGFGHIAVGLASGRLFADPRARRRRAWLTIAGAVALAMLPDSDLLPVWLGVRDHGLCGHRGILHTPLFAIAVGLTAFLICRARGSSRAIRAGLVATLLVASHGLLDAMAQDGRGILFAWPFSEQRFHLPWRWIPDAPTGLRLFTHIGMRHLGLEFVYFFPLVVYTLRPLWHRFFAGPASSPGQRLPA